MIELFMVVAMPFVVKGLTQVVKNIGPIPMLDYRVLIVRALVAVFSLIGAVLTVIVGDMPAEGFDPALIETAVLAIFNAAVATWLYVTSRK